jgi:hypothetical protein
MEARGRRHAVWGAALVVFVALVFASPAALVLGSKAGPAPTFGRSARGALVEPSLRERSGPGPTAGYRSESKIFGSTSFVWAIAASKSTSLVALILTNGSSELELYSTSNNTSWVVDPEVRGAGDTAVLTIEPAGGAFFVQCVNISSSRYFWLKVDVDGHVSSVAMPVASNKGDWFPEFGNATDLFLALGHFLLDVNARTLTLLANYSASFPKKLGIDAVLPVGDRLYVAGGELVPGHGSAAYFGYLNRTSGKLVNVSNPVKSYSTNTTSLYAAVVAVGSDIYVGGQRWHRWGSGPFELNVTGGYLFRYVPSSNLVQNLSHLLPGPSFGVEGLEPWGSTVGVVATLYTAASLYTFDWYTGVYSLSSNGKGLINETGNFLPSIEVYTENIAASGGWLLISGATDSYEGDVSAVRT